MAYSARGSVLTASSPEGDSWFGHAVALSANGLVLAVGVPHLNSGGTDVGGVAIFDWSGSAWSQRGSILLAGDSTDEDYFGFAVALNAAGTVLAVGAEGRAGGNKAGAVYVFDWSGSAWVQRGSALLPGDSTDYDRFGSGLALSDDGTVLAVGAPRWEGTYTDQGGVYLFDWSGSAWSPRGSVLVAPGPAESSHFGASVALNDDGTVLVVGSPLRTDSYMEQGAVYLFDWSGSAWSQRGSIKFAADGAVYGFYGSGVALSADGAFLAVGAEGTQKIYTYTANGFAWDAVDVITAADAAAWDRFGHAVGLSGDAAVLVVGAPEWEGGTANQGGVYVYDAETTAALILVDGPLGAPAILAEQLSALSALILVDGPLGGPALLCQAQTPEAIIAVPGPLDAPAILGLIPTRAPHLYRLTAYVSGGEDGEADYPIPLAHFGVNKRSGSASYYTLGAPFSQALIEAFAARPNGRVHVWRDGAPWEIFNPAHPVRYDLGARSASISLSGTRQVTLASSSALAIGPAQVIDAGIDSAGLLTLDLVPGYFDPRPGDVVTWEGADYTVTVKRFQAGSNVQTLSVTAEAV